MTLTEIVNELRVLHQPALLNSAPFSRDGVNDDYSCLTCRGTHWPCATRVLLDKLHPLDEPPGDGPGIVGEGGGW